MDNSKVLNLTDEQSADIFPYVPAAQTDDSHPGTKSQEDFIEMTAATSPTAASPTIEATAASGGLIVEEKNDNHDSDEEQQQPLRVEKVQQSIFAHIIYLSVAAILGASLRVYLGRFFGGDCEDLQEIPDFLTPVSKTICVTSNGRSTQTGGALFRDLPANILGSFVMGLVSSSKIRIPWLSEDHPAQQDDLFHLMISTGFCGSLTTFASWNTQMVVMMNGTMTELGSQIVVALVGYIFGFMLPIGAFQFGREVAFLLFTWKHRTSSTQSNSDEEVASDEHFKQIGYCGPSFHPFKLLFLLASVAVIVLFFIGFAIYDIEFYRSMVLILPLAPLGAITRWKLSRYNGSNNRKVCTKSFHWFPLGTWTANIVGAICSIACTVELDRRKKLDSQSMDLWLNAILFAVAAGFGGSLSTVSSMVKEIVGLAEANPGSIRAHAYAIATVGSAMAISLIIYSTAIRIE